jgi:hypothetical protein
MKSISYGGVVGNHKSALRLGSYDLPSGDGPQGTLTLRRFAGPIVVIVLKSRQMSA